MLEAVRLQDSAMTYVGTFFALRRNQNTALPMISRYPPN